MRHSQKGMTVFGGFLLLLIVGAVILLALKIAPVYLENYNVKRVLIDMVDDQSTRAMAPHQLVQSVKNRLHVSGIHNTKDYKISAKRSSRGMQINVDYVVRKPVVGNLDALMTFHEDVELIRNCSSRRANWSSSSVIRSGTSACSRKR
jgi:hypothetical protein